MKSRTPSSLKVDREIHDKIKWFRDRGLIKESIQEFVSKTISEKLDILGHNQTDRMLREKLDELIVSMGKTSLTQDKVEDLKKRIARLEKKTHTRSRKDKHRK